MHNATPLSINNLSKSFSQKLVLDQVSFDVAPGEIFGLIGLNGAGKTTMIKIILGLLGQDAGSAHIFGGNVNQKETRRKLAYLPEKFAPSQYLKGKEFLSISLAYFKKPFSLEKASAMASRFDLNPLMLKHKITKYSKGMGQKLGLISAFMSEAPLLILDEPMSGLDPRARIQLKESLLEYSRAGNTIFFSSHILSDIEEICQRIAILHDNKIIYVGTPTEFKRLHKQDLLERAFLDAIS